MDALLDEIVPLLIRIGPWVVFLVAFVETAAFIGLLVPAEATVVLAGFLVFRGYFEWSEILAASFFGGLAGDQVGYALGRFGGRRIAGRGGLLGRFWRKDETAVIDLFRRHSALAVTVGRFLSFARTLMPWMAGMGRLSYPRFLAYDLLGVAGWAVGSVVLGFLAGESWEIAAGTVGTLSASLLGLGLLVAVAALVRRRRAAARDDAAGEPPAEGTPARIGEASSPSVSAS